MNRFIKNRPGISRFRSLALSLAAALLLLAAFSSALSSVSQVSLQEQEESLRLAVSRNAAHFYAVTGRYPQSLEELLKSYPLCYDSSRFFISYQPIGENLMPEILVTVRNA